MHLPKPILFFDLMKLLHMHRIYFGCGQPVSHLNTRWMLMVVRAGQPVDGVTGFRRSIANICRKAAN